MPRYCETPNIVGAFPAELWNTWSNLVIIAFGVAALYLIWTRARQSYDLWLLAFLLIANGMGSLLWHGLRTREMLTFDTVPGILFLMILVYLFARRFYSWAGALVIFLGFLGLVWLSMSFVVTRFEGLPFFAGVAIPIVLVGAILVFKARTVSKRAALLGGLAIFFALIALFFRSIDGWACGYLPMGTHFLWHALLSLGAFLGIRALIATDRYQYKKLDQTSLKRN